ncbi:MAG: hypothetical protein COB04_06620 [Gammaproteobacteria bacterium]|nr:MAG: hypothetical protein COB04_06620 [Gammaproteobacteria bacterium]
MTGKLGLFKWVLVLTVISSAISSSAVYALQRANHFYIAPTALLADPSSATGGNVSGSYAFINNLFSLEHMSLSTEGAVSGTTDLSESKFVTPALLIGYQVAKRLSFETVLAPPDPLKIDVSYPGGDVALKEFGDLIPAELLPFLPETMAVPAVRGEIGRIKAMGAIINANYKFQVTPRLHPYIGAGILFFKVMDVDLKSLSMVDFSDSKLTIDSDLGYFFLVGFDYHLTEHWSFVFDAKAVQMDTVVSFTNLKVSGDGLPVTTIPKVAIEMKLGGVVYQAGVKWAY